MVGVAQWAERLSVEQVVEGSSPFAHPPEKPTYGWFFDLNSENAYQCQDQLAQNPVPNFLLHEYELDLYIGNFQHCHISSDNVS